MGITKKKTAALIGGAVVAAIAARSYLHAHSKRELDTVASVDLRRYAGKWFEIARYPNRFQKLCAGETMSTYTLRDDGKINVVNFCRTEDGRAEIAKGTARVVDARTNAKLKVTFFWPFAGDYWIIGLDHDYRWAVVGEPDRKYLWILSRTPQLSEKDYNQAIRIVRKNGYDDTKLIMTPQNREAAVLSR